jgi:hypothetical protein
MALACPRCGLKNPSTARQCDCGHRFLDDLAEQRSASPSTSRGPRHCEEAPASKNIIVVVAITAIASIALTLVVITVVRSRATSSGISSVESCRGALVEIDVICQSMARTKAEQHVDRLLATPNYYRCGDPRWHDYEPSYVSCFANHERAKQIRTELDAWWSAHQDIAPAEARLVHQDRTAANTSTPDSAVTGSDGLAAVADANVAPDADTTVDVFTNISENGMSLAFDHRTMAFRWQPNQGADRTLKNANTTPAVDACIRVLVAAVRRCQTCTIDSGRSKAAGSVDCWSTRAERCAYANGVPASAVDTCVQQVATAPCSVYEQPTWQLPTGCDGNGLADAAKWPGPTPPGRDRQDAVVE